MVSYSSPSDFLKLVAKQIVAEIQTAEEIRKFTNNPAIVGQYVETSVRQSFESA